MRGKDLRDVVLGVLPIPLVGEAAAMRYIDHSQEGLSESGKVFDRNIRYTSARIAAYGGAAFFTYVGSLMANNM
tara:strand:- start:618 stop:839 length:222 start_codon:yes stop_codon:yes gene_type:complete